MESGYNRLNKKRGILLVSPASQRGHRNAIVSPLGIVSERVRVSNEAANISARPAGGMNPGRK